MALSVCEVCRSIIAYPIDINAVKWLLYITLCMPDSASMATVIINISGSERLIVKTLAEFKYISSADIIIIIADIRLHAVLNKDIFALMFPLHVKRSFLV